MASMPEGSPRSVPDPLSGAWDMMARENARLQARHFAQLAVAADNSGAAQMRDAAMAGQSADPAFQIGGAAGALLRNLTQSRSANVVGADKYFHCKANCEASRLGPAGGVAGEWASNLREGLDPGTRRHRDDEAADQRANAVGRAAGRSSAAGSCFAACRHLRPAALPSTF